MTMTAGASFVDGVPQLDDAALWATVVGQGPAVALLRQAAAQPVHDRLRLPAHSSQLMQSSHCRQRWSRTPSWERVSRIYTKLDLESPIRVLMTCMCTLPDSGLARPSIRLRSGKR